MTHARTRGNAATVRAAENAKRARADGAFGRTHAHTRSRTRTHAHARARSLTHARSRTRTHARSRTHARTGAAERKQQQIAAIGEKITALFPADLRASQPTSSVLYRHLAASLLAAPSKARTAHYAAIAEPLGRAWNAVATAGLLVSERALARTFLLCCARAGSAVSALRQLQPGMLLAIVRVAWPASCSRAVGMPLVPIVRATAEPSIFIDALYNAPIVARIRASVAPSNRIGRWAEYFDQLCAEAAQSRGIAAPNKDISQQLWRTQICSFDKSFRSTCPLSLFLGEFPLRSPIVSATPLPLSAPLRGPARWAPQPMLSETDLLNSLARPPPSAAEAAASMAEADRRFAQLVHTLDCGVTRYVALERAWAEYTSLSWLVAERRTLVETDTELGGHWLRAVQRVCQGHRVESSWLGLLEQTDFEGLLLVHREQAAIDFKRAPVS
jgi:hypothetical protein